MPLPAADLSGASWSHVCAIGSGSMSASPPSGVVHSGWPAVPVAKQYAGAPPGPVNAGARRIRQSPPSASESRIT
jgi:hypothetical protein